MYFLIASFVEEVFIKEKILYPNAFKSSVATVTAIGALVMAPQEPMEAQPQSPDPANAHERTLELDAQRSNETSHVATIIGGGSSFSITPTGIAGAVFHRGHGKHNHHRLHPTAEKLPRVIPGSNATDAFTPDWWRCVITPESSGNFNDTSGGYGILIKTWHLYGMEGYPGNYPPKVQAKVALEIYHDNGGFGPAAWNNTANCGKNG